MENVVSPWLPREQVSGALRGIAAPFTADGGVVMKGTKTKMEIINMD